jgi:hypothetical protein
MHYFLVEINRDGTVPCVSRGDKVLESISKVEPSCLGADAEGAIIRLAAKDVRKAISLAEDYLCPDWFLPGCWGKG